MTNVDESILEENQVLKQRLEEKVNEMEKVSKILEKAL